MLVYWWVSVADDGRLHQVRLLIHKHGADVDSQDKCGRTPLMLSCLLDPPDLAYKMTGICLQAGAYVNLKDNLGRTVVHYVCLRGNTRLLQVLLRDDLMDLSIPDNDGNTPLMMAALSGSPGLVTILVDWACRLGMSVDTRNVLGYTALLLACKYGHYASAYYLLTKADCQGSLRDAEFYFNAKDWVMKSNDLRAAYCLPRRSNTLPEGSSFTRQHTMYGPDLSPPCNHVKAPSHPLGQSLDATLRLPALFANTASWRLHAEDEGRAEGRDARALLMTALETRCKTASNEKSAGRSHTTTSRSRRAHPGTAKLMSVIRKPGDPSGRDHCHSKMCPDLNTLFRMYSDQYDGPDYKDGGARHPRVEMLNLPSLHRTLSKSPRSSTTAQ